MAHIEDVEYSIVLPFHHDNVGMYNERIEEVLETSNPYHIVITELDIGKDSVRSLVSLTRTANDAEKVSKKKCNLNKSVIIDFEWSYIV